MGLPSDPARRAAQYPVKQRQHRQATLLAARCSLLK
jgi:hypothetical protein